MSEGSEESKVRLEGVVPNVEVLETSVTESVVVDGASESKSLSKLEIHF